MSISTATLHKNLKDIFGYDHFRGDQEEIIINLPFDSNISFTTETKSLLILLSKLETAANSVAIVSFAIFFISAIEFIKIK